jgi:hypothetical protein
MELVSKAVVGADGIVVDTCLHLSAAQAQALYAVGVRVVFRYVPLPGNAVGWDITEGELADLVGAGHTVLLVQHPRRPEENALNAVTGLADAQHSVAYALSIGCDPRAPQPDGKPPRIVLDMEGVLPASNSFAHAEAWVTYVLSQGFAAVVYIGYLSRLTNSNCDALAALGIVDFWCDAGPYSERPAPARGYALKQHVQSTLAGIGVDRSDVLVDCVLYGFARPVSAVPPDNGDPAAVITAPILA